MELFYQKSFNVMWLVNQCCQVNLFYVQSDGYEKRKLAPRRYFFHCKKVSQFHLMLWCQDFGKHTVSAEAQPMYPKLCQNCTLSPNFDTRKFVVLHSVSDCKVPVIVEIKGKIDLQQMKNTIL